MTAPETRLPNKRWRFAQLSFTAGYAVLIVGCMLFPYNYVISFGVIGAGLAASLLGVLSGAMTATEWNRRFLAFWAGIGAILLALTAAWILALAGFAKSGHPTVWNEARVSPNWPYGTGAILAQAIFCGMWRELSHGANAEYEGPSQFLLTLMLILALPVGYLLGSFMD